MSMRSVPRTLAPAVAILLLASGCASMDERTSQRAVPAAADASLDPAAAYIQQVEQVARRRGIGVTWVNPPQRSRNVRPR